VWAGLALVTVFVVGFVLVSSVVLVRGRLLDAGLFSEVLVRTDAYERVYAEVLADPELAELTEQLLGGVGVDPSAAPQVRALATSSLRLSVPPSTLRQGTETFIGAVLGYVRGDTTRLDGDVDVTGVVARVRDSGVVWVRARLAAVADRVAPNIEGYRVAVGSFLDRLAAGTVPDTIPVLGGAAADPELVLGVIEDRLGVELAPRLRQQVRAAVLAGDERDGLITAAAELASGRASEATAELRAALEDRRELDVIAEVADRAGRSTNAVVGQLNTVRDAAAWLGPRPRCPARS
jgi:hypothetical protein